MEVVSGWSNDYAKKKYSVMADEGDLARAFTEFGVPLEAQKLCKLDDAHTVLWATAEILARRTLAQFTAAEAAPGKPDPVFIRKLAQEVRQLKELRDQALARIRKAWEERGDQPG